MGILAMQVPPSVYVLVRLQNKDVSRHLVAAEAQCDNEKRADKCMLGMIAAVKASRYVWLAPRGYVNASAKKNSPSLELDERRTVSLVRKSFELIDAGLTVTKAL
jgi:site-specific DNA recombinase